MSLLEIMEIEIFQGEPEYMEMKKILLQSLFSWLCQSADFFAKQLPRFVMEQKMVLK